MSIQPDSWIKKMCKEHNMIEPFLDHQVAEGKISYGLSSMGYDVRKFLFFKSDTEPETTYKSKNGKYQGQTTIQVAKIKK